MWSYGDLRSISGYTESLVESNFCKVVRFLFPKNRLIFLWSGLARFFMEMSLMGTSLFILFRTPYLNSHSPKPDQDLGGVCRSSNPSGCRTHGGPSSMVWSPHPCSPLRWSWGVSGPLERPSGESSDLSTRGSSESQVEHPDGDGCGTQWSVVL